MTTQIRITQAELSEISELERELPLKRQRLEDMKASLLIMLREGVPIEPGRFGAKVLTRIGRPVPWRKILVDRLGQAVVDSLKRAYKTTIWFEAKVVEYATLPLWKDRSDEADGRS